MSDPVPLLVPMNVQALVVNPLVQSNVVFERWTNIYDNLNSFQDPVPQPFTNLQPTPPPAGVHLHWKLPAAMTHGQSQAQGPITFPCLPNRWMVLRRAGLPGATTAPKLTAWIIESDFLDPETGTSPFVDPASTSGAVTLTNIGRSMVIEQWEGEPGTPMFLKPTGLADVTFTAFQPGLVDVLSFHDDASSIAEGTQLTYLIAGWYSDSAEDVLANNTPDQLNWAVLGDAAAAPNLSIVHGMIHGVEWQTTSLPPRIDPDASKMQVAVGYTAVDALSAIIAANAGAAGTELEIKLQALQYAMLPTLDDPDGMAQLELKIRDAWFGSVPGGTRWRIVPVTDDQSNGMALDGAVNPPAPALDAAQQAWVAALNVIQRQYDKAYRELRTMQWDLFALWWKSGRAPHLDSFEFHQLFFIDPAALLTEIQAQLDPAAEDGLLARTIALQAQVAALAAQLPDPTSAASISAWSAQIPPTPPPPVPPGPNTPPIPTLRLRPEALPAFFHPADPVVLIAGLDPPPYAPDDKAPLPCRTVDATATGVTAGAIQVGVSTGTMGSVIQLPQTSKLPPAIAAPIDALAIEAFFADPGNAASIMANGVGSSDPGAIAALASAMAAGSAQIATIEAPLQAGFAFAAWQQAWAPLYLEWNLSWFPTITPTPQGIQTPDAAAQYPAGSGGEIDNWPFNPDLWTFDGDDGVTARGSEYYGFGSEPPGQQLVSCTGRTFLTPQATLLLIRRLTDYVHAHPGDQDMQTIETMIDAVGETRFLSQALSGFNGAFINRGQSQSPPPTTDAAIQAAVGAENRGVPMPELGDQDFTQEGGTAFFFPVRGGSSGSSGW